MPGVREPSSDPREAERLAELRAYDILDSTDDAERFDRITRLVAQLLDVPIALVSLIDEHRQWFKSRVGLDVAETPREHAFCDHAIRGEDRALVVPDAAADPRFADNPLVTGAPEIRFYAGATLVTPRGHRLGTLCAIDRRPRTLSPAQLDTLRALADVVVDALELRRHGRALDARRTDLDAILAHVEDGVALLDADRRMVFANRAYRALFAIDDDSLVGLSRDAFIARLARCLRDPDDLERFRALSLQDVAADRFELAWPRRRIVTRTVKPVRVRDADGFLVVWHDDTAAADLLIERERAATIDPLTGVANRRGGEAAATRELARWRRSGEPLAVAVFDIDHFKRVNDVHGHAIGDRVLCQVADVLRVEARVTDTVIRWGGEEFVVLLPGTLDGAVAFAERVRRAVAALTTPAGAVTMSAGVAAVRRGDGLDEVFARADARLYAAKQAGRDLVADTVLLLETIA